MAYYFVRAFWCCVSLFFFVHSVDGAAISGELKKWHKVTLLFDGVNTDEQASTNPFTNYRLMVTFTNGATTYVVQGHYAADGGASESSASSGNKWRVYFNPDKTGTWTYTVSFRTGTNIAINSNAAAGTAVTPLDGETGSFIIAATDKTGNDFRAQGRLQYAGEHYLQFAETGKYFIKGGADSPENFLGYFEFDQTSDQGGTSIPGLVNGLHEYAPHVTDWNAGDPVWQSSKGKGIIGAVNYLASQGMNSIYFLTYNIDGGDGQDTWIWTSDTEKYRFDVSKLDQWEIVFSQMDKLGIMMHVVTQETENDHELDGGNLGNERKLYYRELVSRFAHHNAIFWNLGEENDNSNQQRVDFAQYIRSIDPYNHPIGFHNWQADVNTVYDQILADSAWLSYFEMVSLQAGSNYNGLAITYRAESESAGKKWIVCGDEQAPEVYADMSNLTTLRKGPLWGNLMGGGGGVEWYFGYQGTFGDLQSEDFTIAGPLWTQTKTAIDFFQDYLPFSEMEPDNSIFSASGGGLGFKKAGEVYAVFLNQGGNNANVSVNLSGTYNYNVKWFDPVAGGSLQDGTITSVTANNGMVNVGKNPGNNSNDWVVLISNASVVPTPEINIKQGSINIPSGGTHTFAGTQVASNTDVVFTIENTGTASLSLTTPLTASGDYSIISQPTSSVSVAGNTTFTVRFTPSAVGTRTGSVTITNSDANEGSYVINFSGNAFVLASEINIKQGSNNIASGGTHTFTNTQVASNTDVVFTIENTGTASLSLTTPLTASGDYSILSQPASSVAALGNTTFTVRFTPTVGGTRTGLVTITNNDSNEGSYVINFSGTGTFPQTSTTWNGDISDDWFDDLNWTNGVPTAGLDVIIPNVAPKSFPVIQGVFGTIAHVKNLTIHSNAKMTISKLNGVELTIHGNLSNNNGQIQGSGKLSFSGAAHNLNQLSFSGTVQVKPGSMLNTNNNLVLEDGASLMHGIGTPGGGGTVNGQVVVKRNGHTSSNLWNYWSSPVSTANVNIIGSTPYYYSPNNATGTSLSQLQQGWIHASGNMTPGLGYIAKGGGTVSFTGNVNNADTSGTAISVNVIKNAATTVGYNLIGNPFPSGLNAMEFLKVNGPNVSPYFGNHTITGSLYFWLDDATGGSGYNFNDFAVWSGAGVIGSVNGGVLPDGNIGSGQGFFVEKISNGTSPVKFSNSMRVSNNDIFFRSAPIQRFWLNVFSPTNGYNETLIAFIDDATDTFDVQYDAKKMRGNLQLALYSKISGNDYAIQALPLLENDRIVEIGLDAGIVGNYTLNLKTLENLDETVTILLEDRLLGTFQSLRMQSAYTFNVQTIGVISNRFYLHFSAPLSINTIAESCDENDGTIELNQPGSAIWNYSLADNSAHVVQSGQNLNGIFYFHNLDGGTYQLTLSDAFGYQVIKNIQVNTVQSVHANFDHLDTGNLYEVNFSNLSTGASDYEWNMGDGTLLIGLQNVTHTYNTPGDYLVQLTGSNDDCSDHISKEINILPQIFTGIISTELNMVSMFASWGKLFLSFDFSIIEQGEVTVYDMVGKRVHSEEISTSGLKEVNFRHSSENCYLVKFTSPNGGIISNILVF